jgi:hypothetical protein
MKGKINIHLCGYPQIYPTREIVVPVIHVRRWSTSSIESYVSTFTSTSRGAVMYDMPQTQSVTFIAHPG